MAEIAGEAHALKLRVVGDLQHGRIFQCGQEPGRERFATCQVDCDQFLVIVSICDNENLEIRGLAVTVHTAFGKGMRGKCLDIHV